MCLSFFITEIFICNGQIKHHLLSIYSLSDYQVTKKTLMCLLIINRKPRLRCKLFEIVKNLICFCANQSTRIYVDDLAKFPLLVKTDIKIRVNCIFLNSLIKEILLRSSAFFCFFELIIKLLVYSEAKLNFVSISFIQWRSNNWQKINRLHFA